MHRGTSANDRAGYLRDQPELAGSPLGKDVTRPAIPPVLAFALSFWASCAICWQAALRCPAQMFGLGALAGIVATLGTLAALAASRGRVGLLWIMAGAAAGTALSFASALAFSQTSSDLEHSPQHEVVLEAVEDGSATDYGQSCAFVLRSGQGAGAVVHAYLDGEGDMVRFGQLFAAKVDFEAAGDAQQAWYWQNGWAASASLRKVTPLARNDVMGAVLDVRSRAIEFLGGAGDASDATAVLQGLVCGYTASYDRSDIKRAITTCGLAHIIAVSGAHLVVVGSALGAMFKALRLPKRVCVVLQTLFMSAYLVLAGVPVSALRAFVMMACVQLSYFAQRRTAGLSALGVCIFGMVAVRPSLALSASFALSALSTLGIALFFPLARAWIVRCAPVLPAFVGDAMALTAASLLMVQPLSCALFSQLPLVALLANVATAPLVGPVCAAGILVGVAGAVDPGAASFLLPALYGVADALCLIVRVCASVPFASIPVTAPIIGALAASGATAAALWAWWPCPRSGKRRIGCLAAAAAVVVLAVAVAVLAALPRQTEVVMLDVGQGDAFLLRSGQSCLLVDTGASESLLKSALARNGVVRLDGVLVTHSDEDHCGALAVLDGLVQVGRVYVGQGALSCPCQSCADLRDDAQALVGDAGIEGLSLGDVLDVGAMSFTVVWPREYTEEGGNADSVCLDVKVDSDGDGSFDARMLFTGDAEADQLDEIMSAARRRGDALRGIDVLKVGHHGSKNALDSQLAQQLSPRIALIGVGETNRYGHPSPQVVDDLEQAGASVLCSDERGDVSCRFSSGQMSVTTLR